MTTDQNGPETMSTDLARIANEARLDYMRAHTRFCEAYSHAHDGTYPIPPEKRAALKVADQEWEDAHEAWRAARIAMGQVLYPH